MATGRTAALLLALQLASSVGAETDWTEMQRPFAEVSWNSVIASVTSFAELRSEVASAPTLPNSTSIKIIEVRRDLRWQPADGLDSNSSIVVVKTGQVIALVGGDGGVNLDANAVADVHDFPKSRDYPDLARVTGHRHVYISAGGVFIATNVSFSNGHLFSDTISYPSMGGSIANMGSLFLSQSVLFNNSANIAGGLISTKQAVVSLDRCRFANACANTYADVFSYGSTRIVNSRFEGALLTVRPSTIYEGYVDFPTAPLTTDRFLFMQGSFVCASRPCGTALIEDLVTGFLGEDERGFEQDLCIDIPNQQDEEGYVGVRCTQSCDVGSFGKYGALATCKSCLDEAGLRGVSEGLRTTQEEGCRACPVLEVPSSSTNDACVCREEFYRSEGAVCSPCSVGMNCSQPGNTASKFHTRSGWWAPPNGSVRVLFECPVPQNCVGGIGGGDPICAEGSEGVLCAVCSKDRDGKRFVRTSKMMPCKECGDRGGAIAATFGIILATVVALVIFVFVNRNAPNGLIRPFIVLVQLLTAFDAPFPPALENLGKALSALSIGFELASFKCAGLGSNYYSFFGYTIATMGIVGLVALLPVGIAKLRQGWTWSETLRSNQAATSFRDLFVLVLLLHPPISGKAMEFFRCRTIEGETYLMASNARADYSIKCYDYAWMGYLFLVVPVLVLFSFGTPCIIAYVLYKRADTLYDGDGAPKPQPLDILFAVYKREAYWFESVQMGFKLALWSTLVFFGYRSAMQLATALVINVLQLCVHLIVLPMGGKDGALLNGMQAATLIVTTYINFGALMMNYLELSSDLARRNYNEGLELESEHNIAVIGTIMEVLTYGLLMGFSAVAAKKARDYSRRITLDGILVRVGSMRLFDRISSSLSAHLSSDSNDGISKFGARNADDRASSVDVGVGFTANPMRNKDIELAPQPSELPRRPSE